MVYGDDVLCGDGIMLSVGIMVMAAAEFVLMVFL